MNSHIALIYIKYLIHDPGKRGNAQISSLTKNNLLNWAEEVFNMSEDFEDSYRS